jgi:molybdate transport system substrate-binding protein
VFAALLLALSGCGGSSGGATGRASGNGTGGESSRSAGASLTVAAAASLQRAFTSYAAGFRPAAVRLSFAGSDILAAQIEQGQKPDMFAAANTEIPEKLYAQGLVEKPVVFAANRLVLAVPAGSHIHTLADVERPGVTVAIGSPTVPIGIYTRKVLSRLGPAAKRILAQVRSQEPDVSGIVGKLSQGAIDAGFTYVTDVRAARGALQAIPLPAALQPGVAYGVAVIRGSSHAVLARQFIAGLLHGSGQADLRQAGFLPPPR